MSEVINLLSQIMSASSVGAPPQNSRPGNPNGREMYMNKSFQYNGYANSRKWSNGEADAAARLLACRYLDSASPAKGPDTPPKRKKLREPESDSDTEIEVECLDVYELDSNKTRKRQRASSYKQTSRTPEKPPVDEQVIACLEKMNLKLESLELGMAERAQQVDDTLVATGTMLGSFIRNSVDRNIDEETRSTKLMSILKTGEEVFDNFKTQNAARREALLLRLQSPPKPEIAEPVAETELNV